MPIRTLVATCGANEPNWRQRTQVVFHELDTSTPLPTSLIILKSQQSSGWDGRLWARVFNPWLRCLIKKELLYTSDSYRMLLWAISFWFASLKNKTSQKTSWQVYSIGNSTLFTSVILLFSLKFGIADRLKRIRSTKSVNCSLPFLINSSVICGTLEF